MSALPRFRHALPAALCGLVVALTACDSGAPNSACTAPRSIAIELTVTDSTTGAGIADSAFGQIVAGAYTDSLHHVAPSATLLIAGESLGTYAVSVGRAGYAAWSRSGIAVTRRGLCGNVLPVALAAPLQPLP